MFIWIRSCHDKQHAAPLHSGVRDPFRYVYHSTVQVANAATWYSFTIGLMPSQGAFPQASLSSMRCVQSLHTMRCQELSSLGASACLLPPPKWPQNWDLRTGASQQWPHHLKLVASPHPLPAPEQSPPTAAPEPLPRQKPRTHPHP